MADYWTDYWQQGHLTSFGEDIKGNYQGPLAQGWQQFFETLEDNSTILDVGCGNGSLILLAEATRPKKFIYTGVDAATLTLPATLEQGHIQFLQNTPAEALPLEDNSLDVVISQFGIEYSDIEVSFTEVARVAKNNADIRFVMHHVESFIVAPNLEILAAAQAISKPDGALERLTTLTHALANMAAREQIKALNSALEQRLAELIEHHQQGLYGTGFGEFLQAIMQQNGQPVERMKLLERFTRELKGLIKRLTDLQRAAKSQREIESVKAQLEQDFKCSFLLSTCRDEQDRVLAWELCSE